MVGLEPCIRFGFPAQAPIQAASGDRCISELLEEVLDYH